MLRQAQSSVLEFLNRPVDHSSVLIVQGARQVGKTYLLTSLLSERSESIAVNLEKSPDFKMKIDDTINFREFELLLKSEFNFSSDEQRILFIDEAQESDKLGGYVRFMKEDWKRTKVVLTGSSMTKLFSHTRVPVGRMEYLTVHGFSFREYLRMNECENLLDEAAHEATIPQFLHDKLLGCFDEYLEIGGLPEAVVAAKEGREFINVQNFIIASQREDFLRKEKVKSYLFMDAMKGVANHVGGPAKYTHIAASNYDAKIILEKLTDWHLIHEVEQKGSQPTQSFAPKRYLYDTGILHHIRDSAVPRISIIHTVDEVLRSPLGGVMENAVLLQLKSNHRNLSVTGWKKNGKEPVEVDFVVKQRAGRIPIEVKSCLKVTPRHAKNILTFCHMTKSHSGYVLSLDKTKETLKIDNIEVKFKPVYLAENI